MQSQKKHDTPIKKNDHPLLVLLSHEPVPLDALLAKTGTSIESLNHDLLMLELEGEVRMVAGGYVKKD